MAKNDFKAFALGENANVLTQEEYEALDAVDSGFQSGIARSEQLNKVWRQSSVITATVASFIASRSEDDVLDDGDLDTLHSSLLKALLNNSTAQLDGRYLNIANNLSDLSDPTKARQSLGLKNAAVQDVGTTSGTVAAGNDTRIVNAVQRGNNLSDLTNTPTARNNLGLGTAATTNAQTSTDDVTPGRVLVNGNAIACRKVTARQSGGTVTDVNALPSNSTSFTYPDATNSPGFAASLLDYSGIGGGYNTQLVAAYSGGGNRFKFRTRNGDISAWNPWYELYHTGNLPTAAAVGALPVSGGTMAGIVASTNREGAGAYAAQYNVKAPFYQEFSSGSGSEYNPLWKQKHTNTGHAWSGGMIISSEYFNIHYASSSGSSAIFTFVRDGQFIPGNYTNFDARYQAKGNYTPAGQAYTKAESDVRYQTRGNYTPAGQAYTKAESDARYVQNVKRGAAASPPKVNQYGANEAPAGCVLTRAWGDPGDNYGVLMTYRPLQIYINGAWRTITG